ncbi:MAG: efflux RND transporter periplasmic adaptor subunit [Acidobacteria bacterium]|nr:efflux RND transporter periplasmic adaptor subunit [Acidobacteriota bacterium]
MSGGSKLLIAVAVVLLGGAGVALNHYLDRSDDPEIDVERIERRMLEAVVSASGTIEPQLSVDISSSVMGRVTRLSINEGDRVAAGQFLLQIDPESLRAAVSRNEASLGAAESGVEQARVAVESAHVNLELARDTLERQAELWELQLISREEYDQARRELELRETEFEARQVEVVTARQRIRQERATLESAQYDLEQVTITSPIDGVVTRRSIEEGETVVIGTMNNPGTVLMTIADFSILEAHVEVDETDIPSVRLGQTAAITIDALPDTTYPGRVTEIGNSPIQGGELGTNQATNFEVVVTLDGDVPGVRPGFTATADIQTAVRTNAVAVPIQSTTVREITLGLDGRIVRPAPEASGGGASAAEPAAPERTEEAEGVFVVRDDRAWFVPVETGIAGDRYFEVISGLDAGDLVAIGPFEVVRALEDGDPVRVNALAAAGG